MRHIPEDELHAYLDQALSRSQCVEIESHLAECPCCRGTRDGIAALRDRTTALLARLAPPRRVPMALRCAAPTGRSRASIRRRRRARRRLGREPGAAVGIGWAAAALRPQEPSQPAASAPVSPPSQQTVAVAVTTPALPAPRPTATCRPGRPRIRPPSGRTAGGARPPAQPAARDVADSCRRMLALLDPAPLELAPARPRRPRGRVGGMWRTMSWDGARKRPASELPHIEGLPVIRVQVQTTDQGRRPLMVVAQQLSSGQVIRDHRGARERRLPVPLPAGRWSDWPPAPGDSGPRPRADQSMAMQVGGDRMLAVTGALPPDSLRAMIRRINAEMRSK